MQVSLSDFLLLISDKPLEATILAPRRGKDVPSTIPADNNTHIYSPSPTAIRNESSHLTLSTLPPELLQIIFELAVGEGPKSQRRAHSISQVSKYWRYIALDTLGIWSYIELSLLAPESKIQEFWNLRCSLVKNRPASVLINDVGDPKAWYLGICKLEKLSAIDSVTLRITSPLYSEQILSPFFSAPTSSFNNLTLEATYSEGMRLDTAIFGPFPPFKQLHLREFTGRFTPHAALTTISFLKLEFCSVEVSSIAALQNLSTLEIGEGAFALRLAGSMVILSSLRSLRLLVVPMWLERLSCPRLTSLFLGSGDPLHNHLLSWISHHKCITTLHTQYLLHDERLANAVPRLQHLFVIALTASFDWTQVKSPRFPALKSITLLDPSQKLTIITFDMLVRLRCLPVLDARSRLKGDVLPLEKLEIITAAPKTFSERWWRSELLSEANKRIVVLDDDDDVYLGVKGFSKSCVRVTLSWN